MVNLKNFLAGALALAAAFPMVTMTNNVVSADPAWPTKPVKIMVSFPPGGGSDLVARLLATKLSEKFDQQFVVENKPGAAGTVATTALMQAPNDGYTFMLSNLTPFNVAPVRFPQTPYDPIADFTHVSYIGTVNLGLFVSPDLGPTSLKAFIDKAKAEPGTLDYGTSGVGSWGHVISALFTKTTGTDLVHIPYKGSGPMRLDFRSGVVPVIFDAVPQNTPAVQDGSAVALAVSASERLGNLPDVPTFTELGFDIVADNWLGFSAPAGLDPGIASTLDAALMEVLELKDVQDQFAAWGVSRTPMSSPAFAEYVASEYEKWKPLVESALAQ